MAIWGHHRYRLITAIACAVVFSIGGVVAPPSIVWVMLPERVPAGASGVLQFELRQSLSRDCSGFVGVVRSPPLVIFGLALNALPCAGHAGAWMPPLANGLALALFRIIAPRPWI